MISQTLSNSRIDINSTEAQSMKDAYDLGKFIAKKKVDFDPEIQKILNELMKKKISIDTKKIERFDIVHTIEDEG